VSSDRRAAARAALDAPSLPRAAAIILLFVAGLVAGVGGYLALNAPPPARTYPALAGAAEPTAAHDLARSIAANDATGIAETLDRQAAAGLSNALQPIVEVTDVDYLGTVVDGDRSMAGYVVHGRDESGQKQIVGIVVDVARGIIVAINE
jgi:hypothetical protein